MYNLNLALYFIHLITIKAFKIIVVNKYIFVHAYQSYELMLKSHLKKITIATHEVHQTITN